MDPVLLLLILCGIAAILLYLAWRRRYPVDRARRAPPIRREPDAGPPVAFVPVIDAGAGTCAATPRCDGAGWDGGAWDGGGSSCDGGSSSSGGCDGGGICASVVGLLPLLLLLAACDVKVNETPGLQVRVDIGGTSQQTIQCTASNAGECSVLVYKEACTAAEAASSPPQLVCTYTQGESFQLKPGESRTFTGPEASLKACTGTQGAPTLQECVTRHRP